MGDRGPDRDRGGRTPSARARAQAADSAEGCDQRCPKWRGRAGRPFGRLRAGSRDGRRDAGATVWPRRGTVLPLDGKVGPRGARGGGSVIGLHDSSSGSSGLRSLIASSESVTGEEITYWPLAHLPRSMVRQRSLQKGKSGSVLLTDFLQMGQRSLTVRLRGIRFVL